MKHSRSGDTLTFGDLIAISEEADGPLRHARSRAAWRAERAVRGNVECVARDEPPGRAELV